MYWNRCFAILFLVTFAPGFCRAAVTVTNAVELVKAVRDGAAGETIDIAAGTYELEAALEPKPRMTLRGAGMEKTILTHISAWKPSTKTLPDREVHLSVGHALGRPLLLHPRAPR